MAYILLICISLNEHLDKCSMKMYIKPFENGFTSGASIQNTGSY